MAKIINIYIRNPIKLKSPFFTQVMFLFKYKNNKFDEYKLTNLTNTTTLFFK